MLLAPSMPLSSLPVVLTFTHSCSRLTVWPWLSHATVMLQCCSCCICWASDGSALTCAKQVLLNSVCDFQRCQLDTSTPDVVQAEKATLEDQVATLQVGPPPFTLCLTA